MKRRRGFALHQLLVVIAVLAVLAGLLLPAVLKVREAAARMSSSNNLKQILIGVHNYAATYNQLPSGVDGKNFSAHYHLLPYIEQEALYKLISGTGKGADDKATRKLCAVVKTFDSPLDDADLPGPGPGPTNYLFVAGTKPALKDNDGVFYRDSKLTFVGITDGTSNTIAAVETLRGDGKKKAVSVLRQHVRLAEKDLKGIKDTAGDADWKADKNIVGDRACWLDGRFLQGTITISRPFNSPKPDVDCGGEGGLSAVRSSQPFTLVAMCDGSVRGVTAKVKFKTWQAATTRDAGDVLPADW